MARPAPSPAERMAARRIAFQRAQALGVSVEDARRRMVEARWERADAERDRTREAVDRCGTGLPHEAWDARWMMRG